MFAQAVVPILQQVVRQEETFACRTIGLLGWAKSYVGKRSRGIAPHQRSRTGYCARMGEVDLRVIGSAAILEQADAVVRTKLTASISAPAVRLGNVIIKQLAAKEATLAVAE